MSAIPRSPFQTLLETFILNYLTLALFSFVTQKKIRQFSKCYYNNIDVKLAFSSFKIGDIFGVKDPIPRGLRTCLVYKFLCEGSNA